MADFQVGQKVKDPEGTVMEVVEVQDDGLVICSFKKGDKRKIKPFKASDLTPA